MNAAVQEITHHDQDNATMLNLDSIVLREGHNPRKTRSKAEYNDLSRSIRAKGVLQSILVRPHPTDSGKYEVVAGETRFKIAVEAGLKAIPSVIRPISDAEFVELAMIENTARFSMSPMDEGDAAQKMLAEGYSKDEVCLTMGWSVQKFSGRIQLTHCADCVRQALADKTITIGHAQILSGLRQPAQESAVKVIIGKKLTVDGFREVLENLSLKLASAPFDTSDCAGCAHNSSTQSSLFDTQTANGRCLNKPCFTKKSEAHMATVKADLAESHNTVELSHEVAEGSTARLISGGPHGVGQDQLNACAACEYNGAIIDTALGNRANVTANVCFNLPCHNEKVSTYQKLIATDAPPANAPTEQPALTDSPAANKTGDATSSKAKAEPKTATIPSAIADRHHAIHREAAATLLSGTNDLRTAQIMTLLALMSEGSIKPEPAIEDWPHGLTGEHRTKAAMLLDNLSPEELNNLQVHVATKALHTSFTMSLTTPTDTFGSLARWYASTRQAPLNEHFVMDIEYLGKFTKPVIGQLLQASGFAADYDAKADKDAAFKALVAGKKDDLLKAVTASGFDFEGFVPDVLKIS